MSPASTQQPLVTIGMPIFNGAQYLAEAIESALAQDYSAIEIVISDNASTDDTASIARRYAERDPRVTYVRQETHLGSVIHFDRVRGLGRGKYFTWLAHDDLLSDARYVSTVVAYLEQHPDVVACASDFYILSHELPGGMASQELPNLYEDRPWEETRRDFFVWPQNASSYAIYSMFRRDALARTPMIQRRYRGKLNPAWWEMPFLSTLAGYGRIVALPMHLRTFRWLNTSVGWRTYQQAPAIDLLMLGLWTKLLLLRVALTVPLSILDRCALVQTTIENFFRANLRRPMDVPSLIDERHREYLRLCQTARERAHLVRSLVEEIEQRRRTVPSSAADESQWAALVREAASADGRVEPDFGQIDQRLAWFKGASQPFWAFFQSTPQWQLTLCEDVSRAVGQLRALCDERVALVERLHAYAECLQEVAARTRLDAHAELREKEQVIVDLRATADERLRFLNEADADARSSREVSEHLTSELQEKVALIVNLAQSADERLRLVEDAHADAAHARQMAEQLVGQLQERDQLIADLSASADERLGLIATLTASANERLALIATLQASADERLRLVEEAHAGAAQARDAAEQLVAQLHEKDQLIADLTASADERLRLLNEATEAAARERATSEALAAQLRMKEQAIEELTIAAEARLQLAQDASAEAQQARTRAERLAAELDEKEQVISGLVDAAAERLSVIERLSQEAPPASS